MISYLYLSYRNVVLFYLATLVLLGVLLTNKEIVPFLALKYAGEYGVKYSKVEGTLLFGVKVQDLRYEDFLSAKSISIRYDFLSLLRLSPKISRISSDSLYLNVDKIPSSDSNESSGFNMAFAVKKILLKNLTIEYDKALYGFDLNATKIDFQETLSVKKIALNFKSSYGNVLLDGFVESNVLKADSVISFSPSTSKEHLGFLQTPPKTLECKLQADVKNVKLTTKIQTLKLKDTQELELREIVARASYSIKLQNLNADLTYKLLYDEYALQIQQSVALNLDGNFSSNVNAKVELTPFVLPFKSVNAKARGDLQKMAMSLDANKLHYKLQSDDYKRFFIQGEAKGLELSFIKELPELLQQDVVSFENEADLQLSPLRLNATLKLDSIYCSLDLNATLRDGNVSALYLLNPKRDSSVFKEFPIEKFSPIRGSYVSNGVDARVEAQANLLKMKLLKRGTTITGDGALSSNRFAFETQLGGEEPLELKLDVKVASLKKTLKAFESTDANLSDFSDVRLDINSTLIFSEPIIVKSSIFVPKMAYKADEQTTHLLRDFSAKTSFSDDVLTLERYELKYKTHTVYSKKSSHILLQSNSDILFKEFWIFDNLLLSGVYKTKSKSGDFFLKSDKFHYKDENADVNVKMDLNASFDVNAANVQGKVTLLDGNVSYTPSSDYTINDPDVIIVQDEKKKKESKILMDVKIDSIGDVLYIHENANVYFRPDVRILKTSTKGTHMQGVVSIVKGEVNLSDKEFVFDKSELRFDSNVPINPNVNLNLHYHTLDYIDILITVTNTLEEPVFIFSSNPALSQNDIMSYILFGESASSMFNSSGNSSKTSLLLGTGIKKLFNANSSIRLDTLNVLTNEDGSLGYEIGSRIHKDMRLVYKNDTVSSVILQYNISKSTRIDVDVRETGQGVSFIYLRDFE